ncbi:hypothetical protein J5226_04765 [Lysobacter sp. K5869]|uniref:hypothetical protein n=1 Tax=Lysobacter sp. K5869 TaxID=2820808 RepID=UPI001C061FDA|nr:hypothetical protein [Lysobacter sp. K5869]QWP77730.1 hypothetical protein J5226_04765 [Lysobacter sp. K5869]
MPYTIEFCNTPLTIPERRWGQADNVPPLDGDTQSTVQFTAFSSCIGICARNENGARVIGIHLSVTDDQGNVFAVNDVPTVSEILQTWGYDPLTVFVIGQAQVWQESVPQAYAALLASLGQPQVYSYGDGTYGAGLNPANVLVPTYAE